MGFTKVSRIDFAEVLAESCSGDVVDVSAEWRAQRERFLGSFTAVTATAWVRDTRWSDAHEWVLRAIEREPTSLPPDGDGWSYLELEFVDRLHAMTIFLRLGPDARIVWPVALRDDFTNYLIATLDQYAGCRNDPAGFPVACERSS